VKMPQYMNCEHNGDGWCINCVTDLQEKIDRLKTQLACCADLVNSWCRETHIAESGSPYDGLELRDAVDRLWSTLAGRLSDSEKEVERLRAELSLVRGADGSTRRRGSAKPESDAASHTNSTAAIGRNGLRMKC
jgi:hypothetical protein